MILPSTEQLIGAANAINRQHPALSADASPWYRGDGSPCNETDGNGARVLRVPAEMLLTIVSSLGVTTTEVRRLVEAPLFTARAWAAIIDGALMARGSPGLGSRALAALENVDLPTLERMAAVVLGSLDPAPFAAPMTPKEKALKP